MKRLFFSVGAAVAVFVLLLGAVNLYINRATAAHLYSVADAPSAQVAFIPGAAILKDGSLSPVFRDRADVAIKLYEAKKVSKILVSGDNSTESHNEVNPVRNYLVAKGIPADDIFLDHAGFDTYSSMYRARDVFKVESMLIATQSFHLPRSVFIARQLGLEASGVRAETSNLLMRNYVREFLATQKAVLDLLGGRVPKYLGEAIPITGDGNNSGPIVYDATMTATFHTTKGDITIELLEAQAPSTVANFIKLAKAGFYDGTKFHRVIKGFMNQGGDPLTKDDAQKGRWGTGGPGYTFQDEISAGNRNEPGTLAMANAGPNTNGSQFFINVADNAFLDGKHTVFGKVTAGMSVVTAINNSAVDSADRPIEPIVITSITLQ